MPFLFLREGLIPKAETSGSATRQMPREESPTGGTPDTRRPYGEQSNRKQSYLGEAELQPVLVGGAAIGGRDHDVLQLLPADADDGIALGVDRRDIEIARLDVGDAGGFDPVHRFHQHGPQFRHGPDIPGTADLDAEAVGRRFLRAVGFLRLHAFP